MNSETINVNFTDNGPDDHGAVFDFDFGALANGESVSFTIFYGAAGNEADALAALAAVGAEVYSLGQPSTEDGAILGTPNTFIFAFAGVGGTSLGGDPHGFLNTFRDIASLIMRSHRRVTGQFTTVDPGSRIAVEQVAAMSQNAKVVDNGLDSLRVYGVINADFGNFDAYGSNAGFTYDSTGMLLGADYQLPSTSMGGADVVVGGSIGFQSIASSIKGSPSGVDADAVVGSLYAYGAKRVGGAGQLHGEARGMFSYLWYDDTRVAGNATHSGSPDGYGLGVDVEVGYQLDKIHPGGNQDFGVQVGPFVGLGYGYSKVDAYQESNGGLAVSSFDDDSLNATVGGRVSLTHETAENTYFAMLQASYTRDFLADGQQVALEDGALFSQLSAPDENLYGLRLVGGMNWGSSIRAMVEYNGALSEHSTQHSLMGRLDFAF